MQIYDENRPPGASIPPVMNKKTNTSMSSRSSSESDRSINSTRAEKVFGSLVVNDSLCYSPSPAPKKALGDSTNILKKPSSHLIKSTVHQDLTKVKKPKKTKKVNENAQSKKQSFSSTSEQDTTSSVVSKSTKVLTDEGHKDVTDSPKSTKTNTSSSTVIMPFGNIVLTPLKSDDKHIVESSADSSVQNIQIEFTDELDAFDEKPNHPSHVVKAKITKTQHIPHKRDRSLISKQISSRKYLSESRSKLSMSAQKAILAATESVNQTLRDNEALDSSRGNVSTFSVNESLNAVRNARKMHLKQVAEKVAQHRKEWIEEKEDAMQFFANATKSRRQLLDLRHQLSSQFARAKADKDRQELQKRLLEIEKEIQFKSEVHVDHKQKLKDDEDKRRRISTAVKADIWKSRRENENRIRMDTIEESHDYFELKWAGERDAEEYKKKCAEERRQSLQFRGREHVRQREEEEERLHDERIQAHEYYELKWAGERDAEEYKKKCAEERRESLQLRGREHVRQRDEEEERLHDERIQAHEYYELKWAGERDAEEYKKKCAEERRESLQLRGRDHVRQRENEEERLHDERIQAHEYYELKWAGERDAEEYKKKCAEERRESLQLRGREHVHYRKVIDELKSIISEQEHESYVLKWAGEDDAKVYLTKLAVERRESLAFRNKEGRRHRLLEEEWRREEIQKAHAEEELQSGNFKDVEAYKKKCAERDRASLQYRGKELQLQKIEMEKHREIEYQIDQARRNLESSARLDVENYLDECKQRRRLSLAFRAKERRMSRAWKQTKKERDLRSRREQTRNAALDRRYAEFAINKELAEAALNDLRHADYTSYIVPN